MADGRVSLETVGALVDIALLPGEGTCCCSMLSRSFACWPCKRFHPGGALNGG